MPDWSETTNPEFLRHRNASQRCLSGLLRVGETPVPELALGAANFCLPGRRPTRSFNMDGALAKILLSRLLHSQLVDRGKQLGGAVNRITRAGRVNARRERPAAMLATQATPHVVKQNVKASATRRALLNKMDS